MDRIGTPQCVMNKVRFVGMVERFERDDDRHDYEPEPAPVEIPRPRPAVDGVMATRWGGGRG
ncbi:hypothetical protein ABZ508_34420 [Streptomyces lavendulocolor]|uniref:Uncharacterized protein n=1 Tax=Streptomyces lavendulocolor TaxID=67316 RepID=A0ABV2WGI6_9ACTN